MSNYRKGFTNAEKYGKRPERRECPVCGSETLIHTKGLGWHCGKRNCLYTENHGDIKIDKYERPPKPEPMLPKKDTSEKIKERIKEIIEKRKEFLREVKDFILKRKEELCRKKDIHCSYVNAYVVKFNDKFMDYLLEKENAFKSKKERKRIKSFLKDYYIKKFQEKWMDTPVFKYGASGWLMVRKALELVLKYGESYCITIYQSRLEGLTKCQVDNYNINPCNCICEKCGSENLISANFCSQCGGKMN
jgi:ribosomal protein S27AE